MFTFPRGRALTQPIGCHATYRYNYPWIPIEQRFHQINANYCETWCREIASKEPFWETPTLAFLFHIGKIFSDLVIQDIIKRITCALKHKSSRIFITRLLHDILIFINYRSVSDNHLAMIFCNWEIKCKFSHKLFFRSKPIFNALLLELWKISSNHFISWKKEKKVDLTKNFVKSQFSEF